MRLDDVPGLLDGVQLATLRGQEHLLEVIVEDFSHILCLVHLEVVHNNNAAMLLEMLLAFLHQLAEED